MGTKTVAETIRLITRQHLTENHGLLLGQCISAVGWVNGTVPEVPGIIELPMTDVAGAGIAVGAAMVGRRPIFVLRFQDFFMLNGSPLVNYAAKSKELHGRATPIFVRAIASEGIGPVHSGVLHSVFMHFPGLKIASPMTPGEYEQVWDAFMTCDDPFIVSEHRVSYGNTNELPDVMVANAKLTLYAVSITRFAAVAAVQRLAAEGIPCNLVHICWLKPLTLDSRLLTPLLQSRRGLVIDADFEIAGASRSIAYELMMATGCPVRAIGLQDATKCLCPPYQNKAPDAERIYQTVKEMLA